MSASLALQQSPEIRKPSDQFVEQIEDESIIEELQERGLPATQENLSTVKQLTEDIGKSVSLPVDIERLEQVVRSLPVPSGLSEVYASALRSIMQLKASEVAEESAAIAQEAAADALRATSAAFSSVSSSAAPLETSTRPGLLSRTASSFGRLFTRTGSARKTARELREERQRTRREGRFAPVQLTRVEQLQQKLDECGAALEVSNERAQTAEALAENLSQALKGSRTKKYVQAVGKDFVTTAQKVYKERRVGNVNEALRPVFVYFVCLLLDRLTAGGAVALEKLANRLDNLKFPGTNTSVPGLRWIVKLLRKFSVLWSNPTLQSFVITGVSTLLRKTVNLPGIVLYLLGEYYPVLSSYYDLLLPFAEPSVPQEYKKTFQTAMSLL